MDTAELSEEQRMMRRTCRDYVDDVVIPFIRGNWQREWQMEPETRLPKEILEKAEEVGIRTLGVPSEFGGVHDFPLWHLLILSRRQSSCFLVIRSDPRDHSGPRISLVGRAKKAQQGLRSSFIQAKHDNPVERGNGVLQRTPLPRGRALRLLFAHQNLSLRENRKTAIDRYEAQRQQYCEFLVHANDLDWYRDAIKAHGR